MFTNENEKTNMNRSLKMVFNVSVATNNGKVRSHNEDNYFVNGIKRDPSKHIDSFNTSFEDDILAEVCDGMGGETNGDLASSIAVNEMSNMFEVVKKNDIEHLCKLINRYVNNANASICKMLENNKSSRGGSTFALVYLRDNIVYPFSLGDSRILLYRNGRLNQISTDHTLAMRKYRANIYTKEEAEKSLDSHKLTLFLGVDYQSKGLEVEQYQPFEMQPGDKLLLCSDGLYDMCSNSEIEKVLTSNTLNDANKLVDIALDNGGTDNVTCIVISCSSRTKKINITPLPENKVNAALTEINNFPNNFTEKETVSPRKNKLTVLLSLILISVVLLIASIVLFLFVDKKTAPSSTRLNSSNVSSSVDQSSVQNPDSYKTGLSFDYLSSGMNSEVIMSDSSILSDNMKTYNEFLYNDMGSTVEIVGYNGDDTTVVIPESFYGKTVIRIADYAFKDKKLIQEVSFPKNNDIDLGVGVFMGCINLRILTNISESLSLIRSKTFENCTSLESLDISDSNAYVIDSDAFSGCSNLEAIMLPDSLKHIYANAFKDCVRLNNITVNFDCNVEYNAVPVNCDVIKNSID